MTLDKPADRVDAWIGHTADLSPAARAAAQAVVRRWAATAGLDEAATGELLDMLGIGDVDG